MKTSIASSCGKRKALAVAIPLLLGAAALPTLAPVYAAATTTPPVVFERAQFADVIEAVQPAVVKIDVTKSVGGIAQLEGRQLPFNGRSPFNENSPFGEFFRHFGPGPFGFGPEGQPGGKAEGLGSGFIIDSSGYIVTNNHVVEGADDIKVTLADGKTLPAKLIGTDAQTDLALLKVETVDGLPAIAFGDSDRARVGDWVVAIGSPFGLGGSVTAGIISARGRDIQAGPYDDYLQIDAPINSGNSGGPIISADGKVIGVNTAIFSPNGGNIGIGFAIPAREAERVVGELRERGNVTRGWLGVQIQPVTPEMAEALNTKEAAGALVAEIMDKSPAERAGITVGDVILKFGDTEIKDARDLSKAVARTEPGSKVTMAILRNGERREVTTVIDRNAQQQQVAFAPSTGNKAEDELGLALGAISPDARAQLNLDESVQGALVLGIKSGSAAEQSGLRPGDVIVRVNRAEVNDADAAKAALSEAKTADRTVVVLVRRGEQQFFTTMKPA